ncbi:MAG: lipocalin family protein [Phaeodactylibacter sp.]|nr:lipocalin family protein [Phaeodactylibacter sp.]MCB9054080.1 lipocalin family protein [Lewinellaceae bacterium]
MNLRSFFQSALLLSIVLLPVACGNEPEGQQELLLGRWELRQATRNGSPTESLSELYFVFNADGSMNTNLPVPGMSEETKYKLDGRNIYQYSDGLPDELSYFIDEISDSTLVLSTEIRNFRFNFVLEKQTATERLQ